MSDTPLSRPAGTLVLMRDRDDGPAEVLMLERSATMRFAAGALVFPGGAVDSADRVLAASIGGDLDPDDAAGRIAAIRETLEEAGLAVAMTPTAEPQAMQARLAAGEDFGALLREAGVTLDLAQLVPFARWWPRNRNVSVFDARFYIARAPEQDEPMVDGTENVAAFWASASEVIVRTEQGGAHVIFPTRRNLDRLALFTSHADALVHAAAFPIEPISAWQEERDGVLHLCIPDHLGYPVTSQPMDQLKRG